MFATGTPPFGHVLTAMVTPFDDDLKIDFKAVERIVEHLISTGTESIVVSGTTGESPTLEDSEKTDLLKFVLRIARGRAKVVMGTGSYSTAKTVRDSREAERLGADGLLVVAPYYNRPSQEGLLRHFVEIAAATRLPIIVYNIPHRCAVNITVETTMGLIEQCPNIHALKDSTGSVEQAAEIAGKARPGFHVYSGDDYLIWPFLSIGGSGIVSVASHVAGTEISAIVKAFSIGQPDRSRQEHYSLLPLFKGLFTAPNPTCVKYALSQLGLCKPNLRLPLVPLKKEQTEALDKVLKQSNLSAYLSRAK